MYSKIRITGKIELMTGLHIGGNKAFSAIGAVDSPIIRDAKTNLPMIPGSSLKGKMRTLLAKRYNDGVKEASEDCANIKRVFGAKPSNKNPYGVGRLIFTDMVLSNSVALREKNLDSLTEVKFENSISRQRGTANPRQIERAIRGSVFDLDLVYEVTDENQLIEDMELIKEGLILLQYDYLGGSGTRGYGKVKIYDIEAKVVVGDDLSEKIGTVKEILKKVNETSKEVQQ